MENDHSNLRFKCGFSKKAIRYNNTIMSSVFITLVILPLIYLVIAGAVRVWIGIIIAIFVIFMLVFTLIYSDKLTKESYLEITADGILKCKYKGRSQVCYPIKEISSVKKTSSKEADSKYAIVPVVLNNKGQDIYPSEGVLIFFNRAWIKSVFPVFVNPEDIDGFISAIEQRMENHATSPQL